MWRALVSLGLVALLILVLMVLAAKSAGIPSPLAEVRETINALKIEAKNPNKVLRRSNIENLILERMDLEEMARRAMGRHWKGLTDAERAKYTNIFSTFIVVYYRENVFSSVEFMNSLNIKFLKENIQDDYAEVEMVITAPDNSKTPVIFKLHFIHGHWQAYDVVVENISTVLNWRSQFDRIMNEYSLAELLKRLNQRIAELTK